jgi:hypothetical protein
LTRQVFALVLGAMIVGCFNADYVLDYGWDDTYINVMHGDGRLLSTRGGQILSGGWNEYRGRKDSRLYFRCSNTQSDLKCFASSFYLDQKEMCLQATDLIVLDVAETPVSRPISEVILQDDRTSYADACVM